jgi:hypothetical protein
MLGARYHDYVTFVPFLEYLLGELGNAFTLPLYALKKFDAVFKVWDFWDGDKTHINELIMKADQHNTIVPDIETIKPGDAKAWREVGVPINANVASTVEIKLDDK